MSQPADAPTILTPSSEQSSVQQSTASTSAVRSEVMGEQARIVAPEMETMSRSRIGLFDPDDWAAGRPDDSQIPTAQNGPAKV